MFDSKYCSQFPMFDSHIKWLLLHAFLVFSIKMTFFSTAVTTNVKNRSPSPRGFRPQIHIASQSRGCWSRANRLPAVGAAPPVMVSAPRNGGMMRWTRQTHQALQAMNLGVFVFFIVTLSAYSCTN